MSTSTAPYVEPPVATSPQGFAIFTGNRVDGSLLPDGLSSTHRVYGLSMPVPYVPYDNPTAVECTPYVVVSDPVLDLAVSGVHETMLFPCDSTGTILGDVLAQVDGRSTADPDVLAKVGVTSGREVMLTAMEASLDRQIAELRQAHPGA
jgi:hypothetical protein